MACEGENEYSLLPPPTGASEIRRFRVGVALARSAAFFGRHFVAAVACSLLTYAPFALWQLSVAHSAWTTPPADTTEFGLTFWTRVEHESGVLGVLLEVMSPLLVQSVMALAVLQFLGGTRVQLGRSCVQGLVRLLPVVGVALLVALIEAGLIFLTWLVADLIGDATGSTITLGLVLLAGSVVLMMVLCAFYVAVPATVVERRSPTGAMSRSLWLTAGARWRVFVIVLLVTALSSIAQLLVTTGLGSHPSSWEQARLGMLLLAGTGAILSALLAICAAVVYHDCRAVKEGVSVDALLEVFG